VRIMTEAYGVMLVPLDATGKFSIHSYITGNVYVDAWGICRGGHELDIADTAPEARGEHEVADNAGNSESSENAGLIAELIHHRSDGPMTSTNRPAPRWSLRSTVSKRQSSRRAKATYSAS
jgi:hypothetical protein